MEDQYLKSNISLRFFFCKKESDRSEDVIEIIENISPNGRHKLQIESLLNGKENEQKKNCWSNPNEIPEQGYFNIC